MFQTLELLQPRPEIPRDTHHDTTEATSTAKMQTEDKVPIPERDLRADAQEVVSVEPVPPREGGGAYVSVMSAACTGNFWRASHTSRPPVVV